MLSNNTRPANSKVPYLIMSQGASYARDAAVSAVRSFYEFLTTLPKLSPSAIKEPPPSGWPNIDANSLAPLQKDNNVIDLLRHLPYITADDEGCDQISYQTRAISYDKASVEWCTYQKKLEDAFVPGGLPDYVVALTEGSGWGSWLLLDTRKGTITDFIQQDQPECDEPPVDQPESWRAYRTLPITEFFESWREQYRSLEWVAIPGNCDDGVLLRHDKLTDVSTHASKH